MILTDREIELAIEHQLIEITPLPKDDAYSSTSLDLLLNENITEFKEEIDGLNQIIDPSRPDFNHEAVLKTLTDTKTIDFKNGYDFYPGKLILAWTKEKIHLKLFSCIAARVEGKSSLARLGIAVHITAPTIHAGFNGQIRLEMLNHGKIPVRLRTGMKICQIIFEQTVGTPVKGYQGRFANQDTSKKG